ncbi:hypothetical protein OH768_25270 [Streptomyces sp. NBC_01622]|uniref:hypothetical protein n=1 Tax=Streptomyces sp. NBC_01622 TaxID=2975903 RepID=UPI00386AE3A2|nr:hypothetical protein OH768_25270 [Streptomyces sp. NBC_01622]
MRFFTQRQEPEAEGPDPDFTTVFDGSLLLPDGRIAVADVEQMTRFVHRLGDRGEYDVHVAVDSPGPDAGAIDVTHPPRQVICQDRHLGVRRPLTSGPGRGQGAVVLPSWAGDTIRLCRCRVA